jgi:hypothetical protein
MKLDQAKLDHEQYMTLASGRIRCGRCQATSKRTKLQCGAPAVKGKRVCRFHGGKSTGPKTDEGRNRCGIAKTVHGGETRAIRAKRAQKMAELKELEQIIKGW